MAPEAGEAIGANNDDVRRASYDQLIDWSQVALPQRTVEERIRIRQGRIILTHIMRPILKI